MGTLIASLTCLTMASASSSNLKGSDEIGFDKVIRSVDRAVNLAFGREVYHRARTILCEQVAQELAVIHVTPDEVMPCVAVQRSKILQVA